MIKKILLTAVFCTIGAAGIVFLGNTRLAQEEMTLDREFSYQESVNSHLLDRQEKLLSSIEKARGASSGRTKYSGELGREIERVQALAGVTRAEGSGVLLTLDDAPREEIIPSLDISYFIVHDEDLLYIVNALRAAGAQAIAINGERILGHSPILCRGPSIFISKSSFTPPYEVAAIGDAAALSAAAADAALHFIGISYSIRIEDFLSIPPGKAVSGYAASKALEGVD